MYTFDNMSHLEPWHLMYAMYLLWIAGLQIFFLIASRPDSIHLLGELRQDALGCIVLVWAGLSLFAAGTCWPMLLVGPFMIVRMGAPISAGVITACYAVFFLIMSGMLIGQRTAPARS